MTPPFRFFLILLPGLILTGRASFSQDELQYVDPRIGNVGLVLEPTRPAVHLPNQFIRVYPNRKDYLDDQISSFPLTLISHRAGQMFQIMPFTGNIAGGRPVRSAWDQGNEITTPFYYAAMLQDYNTNLEFCPGKKSGYFRISFPGDSSKNLLLNIVNEGDWKKLTDQSIEGVEIFEGMKAFVYAEFNSPAVFSPATSDEGNRQWLLTWDTLQAITIEFKYAISLISPEQARVNFKNEISDADFDSMKEKARNEWTKVMGRIKVEGGSVSDRRTFYTALYRCYERMVNISEGKKYYSNYDGTVHDGFGRDFYIDDWAWDTYLALHPLRCILDPEREADMINSYVLMFEQSGWMPTFPVLWGDTPCMNGFHSTIMFLDAYRKGIRDFDLQKAYEGMRKNAFQATMLPWKNGPACSLDSFYYTHGFFPALKPGQKETISRVHPFERRQSVAITLGHSYDDWALSQFARELNRKEDEQILASRSENYNNLYDKEKQFFMPKDDRGEWIAIDPTFDGGMGGRDYYDENNGWTYLWQVQHDIPALIRLMGGEKEFVNRLDQLFREDLGRSKFETWAKFPDFTGITGQFSMGNEPSFHIPYLYNFTGSPWKTQRRIRMLLDNWFPDNIFGIPGDEDGGGMSAFIVFSSMGFYPVVPGLPVYTIGSPVFSRITLNLPGDKKFSVIAENNTEGNVYIQQAFLNGKVLKGPWFTHTDLMNGGELKLIMGPLPDKDWGTDPQFFNDLVK